MAYSVPARGSSEPSYQLVVDVLEKNTSGSIDVTLCSKQLRMRFMILSILTDALSVYLDI